MTCPSILNLFETFQWKLRLRGAEKMHLGKTSGMKAQYAANFTLVFFGRAFGHFVRLQFVWQQFSGTARSLPAFAMGRLNLAAKSYAE